MHTNEVAKALEEPEQAKAASAEEKPERSAKNEPTKIGAWFSQLLNRLYTPCTKGSELSAINTTLKDILEEIRKGGKPKEYTLEYIAKTVDRIEVTVNKTQAEIGKQEHTATLRGWNTLAFSLYAIGLALVSFTNKQYPGLAFVEGGLALNLLAFVFWWVKPKGGSN